MTSNGQWEIRNTAARWVAEDWDEAKHVRDADGRFSHKAEEIVAGLEETNLSRAEIQDNGGGRLVASPIHSGPGPVIRPSEAADFSRESVFKEPFYSGRSHSGGVVIPAQTPNLSMYGRGVYLMSVRSPHLEEYGDIKQFALDVRRPLDYYSPEAKAMRKSVEFDELRKFFQKFGAGKWETQEAAALQVLAQRRGYDAFTYQCEDGGMVAIVFDARKVALVEEPAKARERWVRVNGAARLVAEDWREDEHPRGDAGRFAVKGASTTIPPYGMSTDRKQRLADAFRAFTAAPDRPITRDAGLGIQQAERLGKATYQEYATTEIVDDVADYLLERGDAKTAREAIDRAGNAMSLPGKQMEGVWREKVRDDIAQRVKAIAGDGLEGAAQAIAATGERGSDGDSAYSSAVARVLDAFAAYPGTDADKAVRDKMRGAVAYAVAGSGPADDSPEGRMYRAIASAVYANTQGHLKRAHINGMVLYRGVDMSARSEFDALWQHGKDLSGNGGVRVLDVMKVSQSPLSVWSDSYDRAHTAVWDKGRAAIVGVWVPREQILSLPISGPGRAIFGDVLLAGVPKGPVRVALSEEPLENLGSMLATSRKFWTVSEPKVTGVAESAAGQPPRLVLEVASEPDPEFERKHPRGKAGRFSRKRAPKEAAVEQPKPEPPKAAPEPPKPAPVPTTPTIDHDVAVRGILAHEKGESDDASDALREAEMSEGEAAQILKQAGFEDALSDSMARKIAGRHGGTVNYATLVVWAAHERREQKREERREKAIADAGDALAIQFEKDGSPVKYIVAPAVRADRSGDWQLSRIDERGPSGHQNYATREEAIAAAVGAHPKGGWHDEGDEDYHVTKTAGGKPKTPVVKPIRPSAEILDDVGKDAQVAAMLDKDAGVGEGYSIRQHTEMVLDVYRQQADADGLARLHIAKKLDLARFMEDALALHDIGKPDAIAAGSKREQHRFTGPILERVMRDRGWNDQAVALARALVLHDTVGGLVRGFVSTDEAERQLRKRADEAGVSPAELWALQKAYFTADAASYPYVRERAFDERGGKLFPVSPQLHDLEKRLQAPPSGDQTATPAFKEWFGNSKVTDESGKPLVVYKAMYPYDATKETEGKPGPLLDEINRPEEFPAFNRGEPGVKIAGFFGDQKTANRFASASPAWSVFPVYLSMQHPYVIDAKGAKAGTVQFEEGGKEFREAIRSGKYDGVIIRNTEDEGDLYVTLKPEQAKSAIANRGTWSKQSPKLGESWEESDHPRDDGGLFVSKGGGKQTDSPAFKQWFGNSKIVDREGRPQVMYHGTRADVDTLDPRQANAIFVTPDADFANYFAEGKHKETGNSDFDLFGEDKSAGGNVMPVYVQAANPFDFDNPEHLSRLVKVLVDKHMITDEEGYRVIEIDGFGNGGKPTKLRFVAANAKSVFGSDNSWRYLESPQVQQFIREAGFDGFYMNESVGNKPVKNLAVYDRTQLKSATGNKGTFDPQNPKMNESWRVANGAPRWVAEADWREEEHPRDEGGKFADKGGGNVVTAETHPTELFQSVRKWEDALNPEESQLIRNWGGSGAVLRQIQAGQEITGDNKGWADYLRSRMPVWKAMLDRAPKYEGVVYRGLSRVSDETVRQWLDAQSMTLANDQSASRVQKEANHWWGRGYRGTASVLLVVNQKSGALVENATRVFYGDDPQLGAVDEAEVILRQGTKYKIRSVKYIDDWGREFNPEEHAEQLRLQKLDELRERVGKITDSLERWKGADFIPPVARHDMERLKMVKAELDAEERKTGKATLPPGYMPHLDNWGHYEIELEEV